MIRIPFDLGDLVPLAVTITDAAGAATNATTITLTITQPDGTTAAGITVTNPPAVTGTYVYDFLPTQAGRHVARWVSTGPNAAFTDQFDVRPAEPQYIISLADAKAQQNIGSTAHDEELRPFVEATTAIIERHTGKVVVRRTITEHHSVTRSNQLWLNHRPILSVTSITSWDGLTTWTPGNLHLNGDLGLLTVQTGSWLSGDLTVVHVAGMASVPPEYTMAARIIVQHLWATQRGALGARRPAGAGLEDTLGNFQAGYAIPNAALELLGPPPPMVA